MIITTKVSMDLQRPGYPAVINAVQGDQNTRCLEAELYSNGAPWEVPAGATVAMRYCKPDKTRGYYDTMPDGSSAGSVSGNTISILLAPQMLTVAGTVLAQVELIKDTMTLGIWMLRVAVEENPAAGVLESEDYINWLQWMEQELDDRLQQTKVEILEDVLESMIAVPIINNANGETISLNDSTDFKLRGLTIYGKTTQNGTPSPDNPVPPKNVGDGGSVGVTVAGKNLFNPSDCIEGLYVDGSDHVVDNAEMYSFALRVDPELIYTFKQTLDSGFMRYAFTKEYPSPWIITSQKTDYTHNTAVTLKSPGNEYIYLVITFYRVTTSSYSLEEVKNSIQIEVGNTATEYEPYNGGSLTLTTPNGLLGIQVASGGNYTDENGQQWVCDEVDFARGVYLQRVGTYVYENGDNIYPNARLGNVASVYTKNDIPTDNIKTHIICTHFAAVSSDSEKVSLTGGIECREGGAIGVIMGINLGYAANTLTNDEVSQLFKTLIEEQYAAGTPVTAYYVMKTAIETPLSESELAAYAALHTSYPSTTIYNDAGAGMAVKYVADTKAYIDNKFAALSAAVLNNA